MRSFGRRKGYGGPFQYLEERKYFERDFFKDPLFLPLTPHPVLFLKQFTWHISKFIMDVAIFLVRCGTAAENFL